MTTIEKNVLIAEFMIKQSPTENFCVAAKDRDGFDIYHNGNTKYYTFKQLKFKYDWNWLVPVLRKCFDKSDELIELEIEDSDDMRDRLIEAWEQIDLESLQDGLIEFILWYNQNKPS